jgi:hypothetical protein
MKHIITAILVLGLLFTGCRKKEDAKSAQAAMNIDTTDVKTTPVNENLSNLDLKYAPKKGKEYIFVLTSIGNDAAHIIADTTIENTVHSKVTYKLSVTPTEIEDDGTFSANISYLGVSLEAKSDKEKVTYQSGQKLDSASRGKFFQYEALINNQFGARVKSNGEILELFKTDKIVQKMIDGGPKLPQALTPQQRAQIKGNIEESLLRPTLQQIFRKLSDAKVSTNTAWDLEQDFPVNQILNFHTKQTFTVKGFELYNNNKVARIDITAQTVPQVNPEAKKQNINVEKSTLDGTGKLFYDTDKGLLTYGRTRLFIDTKISGKTKTRKGDTNVSSSNQTEKISIFQLVDVK